MKFRVRGLLLYYIILYVRVFQQSHSYTHCNNTSFTSDRVSVFPKLFTLVVLSIISIQVNMPECAVCKVSISDSVYCATCTNHYGFCCATITEAGYRRLGAERKAAWKCAKCKLNNTPTISLSTDPPSPVTPVRNVDSHESSGTSIETLLHEIRDIKSKVSGLPSLLEEFRAIKKEIGDLKVSCEFNNASLDDHTNRISKLEGDVSEAQLMQGSLDAAFKEISALKSNLADNDQRSRLNNIEIKGLPESKNENLFTIFETICKIIGQEVPKSEINYISRVPVFNAKAKSIIVGFNKRYIKEDFIAAARLCKKLSPSTVLGIATDQRMFINDHLTPSNKHLLTSTKAFAKEKKYSYVWIKHCKIHIRKNDTSRVFVITNVRDLNNLT